LLQKGVGGGTGADELAKYGVGGGTGADELANILFATVCKPIAPVKMTSAKPAAVNHLFT